MSYAYLKNCIDFPSFTTPPGTPGGVTVGASIDKKFNWNKPCAREKAVVYS